MQQAAARHSSEQEGPEGDWFSSYLAPVTGWKSMGHLRQHNHTTPGKFEYVPSAHKSLSCLQGVVCRFLDCLGVPCQWGFTSPTLLQLHVVASQPRAPQLSQLPVVCSKALEHPHTGPVISYDPRTQGLDPALTHCTSPESSIAMSEGTFFATLAFDPVANSRRPFAWTFAKPPAKSALLSWAQRAPVTVTSPPSWINKAPPCPLSPDPSLLNALLLKNVT